MKNSLDFDNRINGLERRGREHTNQNNKKKVF